MAVITVSKQYASNGMEMAKALARRLNYRFIDRVLIQRLAEKLGISPSEAEILREIQRVRLFQLADKLSAAIIKGVAAQDPAELKVGRIDAVAFIERTKEMVRALGEADGAVIVGWGGQLILGDLKNAVHVRVVAEREDRIEVAMKQERCSREAAMGLMERRDKGSRRFIGYYWQRDWDDPTLYDAVLNASRLGSRGLEETVLFLLRQRGLLPA